MVSYYNSLTYPQKHTGYPPVQSWFSPNYHPTSNHQLLSDIDPTSHHQPVYYNPHHVFPQGPTMDWHNHETFSNQHAHAHVAAAHAHHAHAHQQIGHATSSSTHHDLASPNHGGSGNGGATTNSGNNSSLHLSDITGNSSDHGESGGGSANGSNANGGNGNIMLPISPTTLAKSELSSPTSNLTPLHIQISHHHHQQNKNHRTGLVKSPYYDWMKKPPYTTQNSSGKTRTKDKYRVVYTDFQRLELEKEYLTSRYITIRRKTELAQALQLSERQVKIWFQNRRAKERKQNKKRDENDSYAHSTSDSTGQIVESKSKIDSPANLSHSLHQMPMGMSSINLHHHPVLQSGHLTISPVHHTHHSPVSVQSLPM